MTFIEAIARQEGSLRAHPLWDNPGDIEDGPWAQRHGALPPVPGQRFARWPTVEAGFKAMEALLLYNYIGLTVLQGIQKWAPAVENDDDIYVRNVCEWTGLAPTDILTIQNIG